jgi:PAS domain S-box-containing protein
VSNSADSDILRPNDERASRELRQELESLAGRGAAVLVISADGTQVLWSTPAGAHLFGARSAQDIESRPLDPRLIPVGRLAELAQRDAPSAGARLERVRIHAGRRSEAVTLSCRRAVLPGGEPVLVAVGFGARAVPGRLDDGFRALPDLLIGEPEGLGDGSPAADADAATPDDSPDATPEPVTLESLRARNGSRPVLRFVWQTDKDGCIVSTSPELAAVLGDPLGPLPGTSFDALLRQGIGDPVGSLAAALADHKTFTGIELAWPVDGAAFRVPVALSGVPGFDAQRAFTGFRGFGVCRLDRELPPAEHAALPEADRPTELEADEAEAERAALAEDGPSSDERASSGTAELEPLAEVAGSVPEVASGSGQATESLSGAPVRQASPEAANDSEPSEANDHGAGGETDTAVPLPEPGTVVSFGEVRVNGRPQPPGAKVVHLHGPPLVEAPALSRSERHAFREIARALGARIEGQEDDAAIAPSPAATGAVPEEILPPPAALPDPEPEPVQAEVAPEPDELAPEEDLPEPAPVAVASDLSRHADLLFDRLPLGILVSRGAVPIVMNRPLLDLLGYDTIDAFFEDGGLQRLFRGRPPEPAEGEPGDGASVSLETSDGSSVLVETRLQTIVWDGLPATMMSFRRSPEPDANPRLRAAEMDLARRENDARELRAMLDTATDGVVTIDEAGRILSVNRSGEALFGYDQREVAGEAFISLLAPDSHATALDYLEGLRSNGVASIMNDGREVIGRVRQGGRIPLFMTLGSISEAPDRKFCAVLRDLTPWKKAETELVEARKAAEEASAQKSDFLAKISHEIRTPLSAIIGFAEVMIEERFGPIGNERYLEYLRDIHASGGHVISLVNDLLDLSKIEAGRFDLTFVSVDLNEIVSRSVAIMQPQAGTGKVVVRTALAPRLPRVVADERSLRQIVLNLLSNAIKFTDPGGQVIVSTAFTDAGEVVVRVRDTGIGMNDKDIETALEPFRQVATTRRSGGTGLGLPLTKALIEANRAALVIRSAREAGTLVEVTFPTTRVLAE